MLNIVYYIQGTICIREFTNMEIHVCCIDICVLGTCNANAQLQELGLSRIVLEARNSCIFIVILIDSLIKISLNR